MEEKTENSEYYAILNCAREASTDEVVRAYRKLAQVFHPDKHLDEGRRQQAQESFSKVQEAYEVLSTPEKRQVYDVYGKQGLAAGVWNVSYFLVKPSELLVKSAVTHANHTCKSYARTHAHTPTYTHTHTHTHTHTYTHTHTHVRTHTHTHTHTHTRICTHTYTHTHTYAHIHTYTHTYNA